MHVEDVYLKLPADVAVEGLHHDGRFTVYSFYPASFSIS
jgi:hypothetical protein